MPRADELTVSGLYSDGASTFDDDAPRFGHQSEFATRLADGRLQRSRQRCGSAARHLRLGRAREQGGNVMAETAHAQIDLAQTVEEQKAGPHRRMLELLLHELKRRQRADFEQAPTGMTSLEQSAPLVRRKRWRPGLPCQNVLDDRDKLMLPSAQRLGVLAAELLERPHRAVDIGPPSQHAAIARSARPRSVLARCSARRGAQVRGPRTTASW